MSALFYIRLIGFTAGALLYLFLLVLIVGHRRPRAFERVLFFLILVLFLFYSGALLGLNSVIHYVTPPAATLLFAVSLMGAGLALAPPLLVHAHAEYEQTLAPSQRPGWQKALVWLFYLPLVYFVPFTFPQFLGSQSPQFPWPGFQPDSAYVTWLALALLACAFFERRVARRVSASPQRRLHQALAVFFLALGVLTFYAYALGGPRNPAWSAGLGTAVLLAALFPGALLGYYILRYNFLQIGLQRNLVYAVAAVFLALLYLALVRRVGVWLEPVLPPEATASILLFILVFLFEPLQRTIGRGLSQAFELQMDRLQRLTGELQRTARQGELGRLCAFAERRIREEFGLAEVRILVSGAISREPLKPAAGPTSVVRFPLREGREEIGALEAGSYGAFVSGETYAALEFLAEQLPAAIGLCRLIDEKLKLERELAERERLALVGQMAASISHNLRNPLSSMKTVLQVLLENRELPQSVRGDCELVAGEIDRLASKLNQLLRYAKPSVRAADSKQRVDAAAVIEQVVALLKRDAERRHVTLEFKHPAPPVNALGSEEAVSDVASNLIVNAIEALPSGGNICVSLAPCDGRLNLEVTDDGPGISAPLQAQLFRPFFTTKPSGTGLGLAIVEKRLLEMDGSIACESPVREGKGTRFTVTLPLAE